MYRALLQFSFCSTLIASAGVFTGCGDDSAPAEPADAADTSADAADVADTSADSGADDVSPDVEESEFVSIEEALDSIDVFIGSGGLGFGYASLTPAVQMPNGFVKVGPDTSEQGSHLPQAHFSGYNFYDGDVRGFSHIRLVGTGATDLGNLRAMPYASLDGVDPWDDWQPMDKSTEQGSPGYYSVSVGDEEPVLVELTAGWWSAVHRYTFSGATGFVVFDVTSSITRANEQDSYVEVTASGFEGWLYHRGGFAGRRRGFTVYFSAVVDRDASAAYVWNADGIATDETSAGGIESGVVLEFDGASTAPVELRIGLSLVDLDAARANRGEVDDATFEEVVAANRAEWADRIGRVRVGGGTALDREKFYSALYNAHRMPTRLSEPDGRYRGSDNEVHTVDAGRHYYTDLSLWDTFRTLHPWYELVHPELQIDCLWSLLRMYEQEGRVPRWPAMLGESGSMLGSSANMLFAGSMLRGLEGIDWSEAFEALYESDYGFLDGGTNTREQAAIYIEHGYMPEDVVDNESISLTLEYAWADDALQRMAAALDDPRAEFLEERAQSFERVFDPVTLAFWPRNADGTFVPPGNLSAVYMGGGPYTEGSAWHWRFYALQRPNRLVELFGGQDALGDTLEEFFTRSALGVEGVVSTAIPDRFYWHGNEPAIHSSSLFDAAGRPERRWYWMRQIQDRLYNGEADGIPGNDDGGTLSTWFAFTAIGLFPVAGTATYLPGAPRFDVVEIEAGDATIRVEAPGVTDNGEALRTMRIGDRVIGADGVEYADLLGATVVFAPAE